MITNIRLQQFRSYQDASFEFESGVNIIVGPNASGKTNLLEAVLMVAQGSSYRAQPAELIRQGDDWARIDADVKAVHRTVKLEKKPDLISKTFEIDGQTSHRLGTRQQLPVVLFEPNHLLMLSGSPENRRNFADNLISQLTPGYATSLRKYRRALSQRNRLLKEPTEQTDQFFVWDVRLSQLASQIVAARQALTRQLNDKLAKTYGALVKKKTDLSVTYNAATDAQNYASQLLKRLEKDRPLDRMRGFTAAGPHREDLIFAMSGQPLSTTASRGENRTTLLALKIIELQLLEAAQTTRPLLLLDDVFSELDGARRRALTELMRSHQTFITTTDADIVAKNFGQGARVLSVG